MFVIQELMLIPFFFHISSLLHVLPTLLPHVPHFPYYFIFILSYLCYLSFFVFISFLPLFLSFFCLSYPSLITFHSVSFLHCVHPASYLPVFCPRSLSFVLYTCFPHIQPSLVISVLSFLVFISFLPFLNFLSFFPSLCPSCLLSLLPSFYPLTRTSVPLSLFLGFLFLSLLHLSFALLFLAR